MAEIKGGIIIETNKQINTVFQEVSILKKTDWIQSEIEL